MRKRIAAINTALVALLLLVGTEARAYTYYDIFDLKSGCFKTCVDSSGGLFASGEVNGSLEIWYVNENSVKPFSFYTDGLKIESFSGCGSMAAAVLSGTEVWSGNRLISQLQVLTYDFNTNSSDVNTISAEISGENGFALGKNGYYIIQHDLKTIQYYSLGGRLQYSIYSDCPVYQLIYDNAEGKLYTAYDGGMYVLNGRELCDIGGISTPVTLSGKAAVTGNDGRVYSLSSGKLHYMCDIPSGKSAAVIGNKIYYSSGSVLYGQTSSGKIVQKTDIGDYIETVLLCGSKAAVISSSGELSLVAPSEMTNIKPESNSRPSSSGSGAQGNGSKNDSQGNLNGYSGSITSSVYTIDNSSMTISGIKHGTTIASFKSNIKYGGYKVSFKNHSGNSKTSGNVGTGFTVKFSGADEKSYTLIVPGDLTGEGNVNSRDVNLYMSCLCGETELAFPFAEAFDINSDSQNDTIDMLIASRQ